MSGWTGQGSPFHAGEQAVQTRMGVRDQIEKQGQRLIRRFMPEQHREFYAQLPFLVIGALDPLGRPWASLLVGESGFITAPDDRTLRVQALPVAADPLGEALRPGADVGLLGIALGTRRRNRLNGVLSGVDGEGLTIRVTQTFGNCPMYIQKRQIQVLRDRLRVTDPTSAQLQPQLDPAMQAQITSADTLFIATGYGRGSEDPIGGADVSHRGGKPGFVRVDDDRTLTFPDFAGNLHFNTVGNVMMNPKLGLIFPDFQTGDLITLTGWGEILWEGEEVQAFEGAERLFRIHVEEVLHLRQSLPLRAELEEFSPVLQGTGSWQEAAQRIQAQKLADHYRPLRVIRVDQESETIRSLYLQPQDDHPLVGYKAGQCLPIRVRRPHLADLAAQIPLSEASGGESYRISVGSAGELSAYLYNSIQAGDLIEALAPRGNFTLDPSRRPVVLLSEGAGIGAMVAFLHQITKQVECCGIERVAWLIHQSPSCREQAFLAFLRRSARYFSNIHVHIVHTQPLETEQIPEDYDSQRPIDLEVLNSLLPPDDYEYYISGSTDLITRLHQDLTGLPGAEPRIHRQPLEDYSPEQRGMDHSLGEPER